jgi:hypothetical protein
MKNDILKRAMFAMPLSKASRNTGIMSGFDEEDMQPPEEDTMPSMARTPQNPEILMNNLRGDIRSVDARRQELALMVGEDAADETPPEVLAMLQMQLAQQQQPPPQQGIGALPQAQGMPPPDMGAPPPDQGGASPQGAMPPGMESAGPLPQGGADQAPQGMAHGGAVEPPTPDGMPPMHAFLGALAAPATRMAQMAQNVGARVAPYLSEADAAMGRMFMNPSMSQPFLDNVRGPGGRFTAEQINRGGEMLYPTLSQGIGQGLTQLAQQYPTAAKAVGAAGAATAGIGSILGMTGNESTPMSPEAQASYDQTMANLNATESPMNTGKPARSSQPDYNPKGAAARGAPPKAPTGTPVFSDQDVPETDVASFISDQVSKQGNKDAGAFLPGTATTAEKGETPQSRLDRIKNLKNDYQGLYRELLGGDTEDAKANALLLISEAGFKFGASRAPTTAMALSEAASGVPRGFAAILAQQRDRQMKVDSAALSQAITDVDSQDKYAQAIRLEMIKGEYGLLREQSKLGGNVLEDAGLGGRISKTRQGSYSGFGVDPQDPSVISAVTSPYTLRDTDNPYVRNLGQAPTTVVTDKEGRLKLGQALSAIDNNLNTIAGMKGIVANGYSPGTWVADKVNNLFVPVSGGMIRPNFNTQDAATRLKSGFTSVAKGSAAAQDTGRVAVQQQEWEQGNLAALEDPTAFFKNPELAAKTLNSLEATQRNARQSVLTQLGYEKNNYVMDSPNIGTKNDPFTVPADKDAQKVMFNFLGGTIGKVTNPNALIYLRLPNGNVSPFNPVQLQGLLGAK